MSLITQTQNQLATVRQSVSVPGMLMQRTKTGALKLQMQNKKAFTDAYKANPKSPRGPNGKVSNKQATTAFDAYRIATLSDFNRRLGTEIIAGNIVADTLSANSEGELTTARFVRRPQQDKDRITTMVNVAAELPIDELLAKLAAARGITVDQLRAEADAQAAAKKQAKNAPASATTLEAQTSNVPDAPAPSTPDTTNQPNTPATEPAPAPQGSAQAVETSA